MTLLDDEALARRLPGASGTNATGSQAFTTTLRKTAGHGSRRTQQLLRHFGTAADTEPGALDLLVCDDVHQLRAASNARYTPASHRSDRSRTEQLLGAARVVVFLLDEEQAVRPGQDPAPAARGPWPGSGGPGDGGGRGAVVVQDDGDRPGPVASPVPG